MLNTKMKGKLLDPKGKVIKTWDDEKRIGDIMTVGEVLQAAGISLDSKTSKYL